MYRCKYEPVGPLLITVSCDAIQGIIRPLGGGLWYCTRLPLAYGGGVGSKPDLIRAQPHAPKEKRDCTHAMIKVSSLHKHNHGSICLQRTTNRCQHVKARSSLEVAMVHPTLNEACVLAKSTYKVFLRRCMYLTSTRMTTLRL